MSDITKNKAFLYVSLSILFASVVRLIGIFNWDSYLFDEMISVSIALKPLAQMWDYLRWEMHPPLHFYYLHVWIDIFGASEVAGRMSSFALGILTIPAMYFLGKELFSSRRSGAYAAFLTAISSFQGFYSIWTRMYMLLFLLSTLSFYFFSRALKENKTWLWVVYTIVSIAALYTHLTLFAIPAVQLLYVLYLKFQKQIAPRPLKTFGLSLIVQFLAILPWIFNFITVRLTEFSSRAWYFWAQPYDLFFINVPIRFMIAGNTLPIIEVVALVLFGAFFIRSLVKISKKDNATEWSVMPQLSNGHVLALLTMFIPLIAVFAFQLNALRLYMLPAIGVYLLFANGLSRITFSKEGVLNKLKGLTVQGWIVVMISTIVFVPLTEVMNLPEVGWEKVATFIEEKEQPGDKIIGAVYGQLMTIDFYYDGQLEADAVLDDELRTSDRLLTILKTNFFPPANPDNIHQLERLTQGHDRVFLVFSEHLFGNAQDMLTEWFIANDWYLEEKLNIGGFTAPQVWLLIKE